MHVSMEFFPPRTEKMKTRFQTALTLVEPLAPDYISVTHGAGGSSLQNTFESVKYILHKTSIGAVPHITCRGSSRDGIRKMANDYWDMGVRQVVALRGDSSSGEEDIRDAPKDTNELIELLASTNPFEINVGGYPEKHPAAPSFEADTEILKSKVNSGATKVITQFALDTEAYVRYRDRVADVGVRVVPGIIITTNFGKVADIAGKCGVKVPSDIAKRYEGLDDDIAARRKVATDIAVEQCEFLLANGINSFHIYTINDAEVACNLVKRLKFSSQAK